MSDTPALEAAALEAKLARERFQRTAETLQSRLEPSRLLDEAVVNVREGATDLAITSARAAQRNPRASAAVAGGTMLLLLRKPLMRIGCRLFRRKATR